MAAAFDTRYLLLSTRNEYQRKKQVFRKLAFTDYLRQRKSRFRRFFRLQNEQQLTFEMILNNCILEILPKPRSIWSKPRAHVDFWEDRVLTTYDEKEFFQDFRMPKGTFLLLCDLLRNDLQKQETQMRKPISVERRVAASLYKLATPGEFRTIGNLFSIARNTACVIFHEFCLAVNKILLPKLNFPTNEEEIKTLADGFLHCHRFPHCVGAIDGCHIPIIAPTAFPKDYYNRKGWHSILLQAVVDCNGRFLDINVGWPGSVHDARVLANSSIYERAEEHTLLPDKTIIIEGQEIPYMIVGDPAYPLRNWLMKGFSDSGRLTEKELYFNNRLSSARIQVEHAFGRLKGRWRALLKRNDSFIDNVVNVISTACAMHNFCEENKAQFDASWVDDELQQPENQALHYTPPTEAKAIRKALVEHFWKQKINQ